MLPGSKAQGRRAEAGSPAVAGVHAELGHSLADLARASLSEPSDLTHRTGTVIAAV